jgi:8-oxo-dGTP diphosphatase
VLLVHRPRYDDWTVPKGKLDAGEDHAAAALREVEEETGLRCALGPELASTEYVDRKGRPKQVRYWAMTPAAGEFTPTDEVDDVRWVAVDAAESVLTYQRDREVIDALRRVVR